MPEPRFRAATQADVADIAILTDIAGEGMPVRLWMSRAGAGQSPLEIARTRALRVEGAFTYRNAQVATVGGAVVGLMLGYPLHGEPDLADVPQIARPLVELEGEATGHWYVNILGVYPEHRGQGIGGHLLRIADELGRKTSPSGMAIIVASENG
ncbi:MAG: GNAT family N-acetyltransferase, partial [Bauldia sp.]